MLQSFILSGGKIKIFACTLRHILIHLWVTIQHKYVLLQSIELHVVHPHVSLVACSPWQSR